MLFLEEEVRKEEDKEKGQKGGLSNKNSRQKVRKNEINTDFMYINYEI